MAAAAAAASILEGTDCPQTWEASTSAELTVLARALDAAAAAVGAGALGGTSRAWNAVPGLGCRPV